MGLNFMHYGVAVGSVRQCSHIGQLARTMAVDEEDLGRDNGPLVSAETLDEVEH
jgi:hypothetical protein